MKVFHSLSALAVTLIFTITSAHAAPRLSVAKVKQAGVKVVPCPNYVGHPKSGLASSVLKKTSICTNGGDFRKIKKYIKASRLVLDGSDFWGAAFPEVSEQEGDVQTEPFEVGNYPAIVSYRVDRVSPKSTSKVAVLDAETGDEVYKLLRGVGATSQQLGGVVAINIPGRYFLRIAATGEFLKDPEDPENGEEIQPIFSVAVTFMDRYEGFPISAADIKDAGLRKVNCPSHIIDSQTGRMYKVGKKYFCSNSAGEDFEYAGFTIAPLNLGLTMFVATEVSISGTADRVWLPFRVIKPTQFNYSTDDPSMGRGKMQMNLIELSTGKKSGRFVDIKGSISYTTTSLNIPGDYYSYVTVDSYNREEFGELEFSYDVMPEY